MASSFLVGLTCQKAKILWQFSLPLLLDSALHAPIMWLCQIILARQSDGISEIGMYSAALKWMTLVMLVPISASAAFSPVLANLSGEKEKARSTFKQTTRHLAVVQLILTIFPAAIIILVAPWAASIFGEGFISASPVIVLMMSLAPIFVLKNLYWQALTSGGYAWTSLSLSVLWAVIAVSVTWTWKTEGAIALARAMLVAYGVTLTISILIVEWKWRRMSK